MRQKVAQQYPPHPSQIINSKLTLMSQSSTVDLNKLCLHLVNIVSHSCELLHRFSLNPQVAWKKSTDPVTEVDYLIQAFLVESIQRTFPDAHLNIVAEEDLSFSKHPEMKECIDGKIEEARHHTHKVEALPFGHSFKVQYPSEDLCLWIDPLDCTWGLVNGKKHLTTILIGVTLKGKPVCGVIGQPYRQVDQLKSIYEPSVVFGSCMFNSHCAFELDHKGQWRVLSGEESKEAEGKVSIGWRKLSSRCEDMLEKMQCERVRSSGAGFKALKVIRREVESLVFVDASTCKWDSCAAEAIIRAMGGYATKPTLKPIQYCKEDPIVNKEGFILTLSQRRLQQFEDHFKLVE